MRETAAIVPSSFTIFLPRGRRRPVELQAAQAACGDGNSRSAGCAPAIQRKQVPQVPVIPISPSEGVFPNAAQADKARSAGAVIRLQ
jgi:hypothetical protein